MIRSLQIFLLLILIMTPGFIVAQQDLSLSGKPSIPPKHVLSVSPKDSIRRSGLYQSESIYLQLGTYTKNGLKYDIGIIGGRLKHEMLVSPEAMAVFKKYQKQKTWSLVCAGAQLVTQVAAFTTRDKSRRTALHISGGAISIVSIPLYFGSYKNLNKAVWIRNGAVLFDE